MSRWYSRALAIISLLALVAFAVRAVSLDFQSLWRDEVDALHFATAPWREMLSSFTRAGWNGPLYHMLLRGWIGVTGTSEYTMRFFSLISGVLCVPLAYTLGLRLFNRFVGFISALLMATSPYLTWYGQEVKMYTLVPALALLAIYALRRAVQGEGWHWWAVQIVATSLAFYSHILAVLLIPVQVLLYCAWWPEARQQWRGALTSLACLTLPYLPLASWQIPLALQRRETGFGHYSLGHMVQILLSVWSTGMTGWGRPWAMVLTCGLAAWALLRPTRGTLAQVGAQHAAPPRRAAVLGWLVTPVLVIWLVSLRQPLFTDRYLIWVAPAFYLLVAVGLASFWGFEAWGRWVTWILLGIILALSGVNLWQQATRPMKSNFRAAAAYIADYQPSSVPTAPQATEDRHPFKCYLPLVTSDRPPTDALVIFQIPHGRHTFDYYFPEEEYPWVEGLYTNHRAPDGSYLLSEQEIARRMRAMTAGYDAVWLVATETAMWDERGLVQDWLDTHAQRVAEAHFTHVDVYRYVWNP